METDIDTRLVDLWREASIIPEGDWDIKAVAASLRAAYAKGYCDALSEEERGQLTREHGYRTPSPGPKILPEEQ